MRGYLISRVECMLKGGFEVCAYRCRWMVEISTTWVVCENTTVQSGFGPITVFVEGPICEIPNPIVLHRHKAVVSKSYYLWLFESRSQPTFLFRFQFEDSPALICWMSCARSVMVWFLATKFSVPRSSNVDVELVVCRTGDVDWFVVAEWSRSRTSTSWSGPWLLKGSGDMRKVEAEYFLFDYLLATRSVGEDFENGECRNMTTTRLSRCPCYS